jgi:hypothetical protein
MKLKILDLFSGIGGFSLGFENTEFFETVAFCEIDKHCHAVLNKNFPNVPIFEDIKNVFYEKEGGLGKLKKMTEDQVTEATKMYENGFSLQEVGDFFNVSRQSMHDLLKRRIKLRPQARFGEDNNFYRGGKSSDQKTWNITEKAIARGKLVPKPCEVCGVVGEMSDGRNLIQAHHDDYNKPLDVRWLCQKHHFEWHQSNTPIKRKEPQEAHVGDIDVICGGFP